MPSPLALFHTESRSPVSLLCRVVRATRINNNAGNLGEVGTEEHMAYVAYCERLLEARRCLLQLGLEVETVIEKESLDWKIVVRPSCFV